MQTLVADFQAVQAHWAMIVIVLGALVSFLSTLQTALTPYPKVESVITKLIGIFSFAQHADVGGLSLPGFLLRKPGVPAVSLATGGAVKALLFLAFFFHLTACAAISGATLENDLVSCGESAAPGFVVGVASALAGPSDQVETALAMLALTDGGPAVYCVVKDLVAQEEAKLQASQNLAQPAYFALAASSLPNLVLIVRGEQYLHGLHVDGSKLVHRHTK